MLQLIEILFIAAVQGIGEFLPISSSGHLSVVHHLFTRFGQSLAEGSADFIKLNVLLHVGTLFAVLVVFRRRILDLFGKDIRLIPLLIVGTIPAVIIGLGVKKSAPWLIENLFITGVCFAITGVLLIASLLRKDGKKTCSTMTYGDALFIGITQAVAILPGISRSGSTIVAGLFRDLRRDEAATFSFLLAIPVIAGGGILELKDLFDASAPEGVLSPMLLLLGMLVSFGVGMLALTWLLDWLQKGRLWYFALWVFLMCPLTLALAAWPMPETTKQEHEGNFNRTAQQSHQERTTQGEAGETVREDQEKRNPESLAGKADETSEEKHRETSPEDDESKAPLPISEPASDGDSLAKAIENTGDSGRINLTREEALREYERILAEEEAAELALIEEEQKRLPLGENIDELVPLDPKDRIWISRDGRVIVLARVALREGFLELFGCRIGTKEHESIVSVRVKPHLIHAALLAVGAEAGKPVQVSPTFVPPSGDEIEIKIRWRDDHGEQKETDARDWVWDMANSPQEAKKTMSTHWVFTGSMSYRDDEGENHYVADETGELFGLSNFVGAILDVPIESSADNTQLMFSCHTQRIPEVGTPLTLILTPTKNKKRQD